MDADTLEAVDKETLAAVRQLVDRQAILDCLMRYSRGVDRFDEDLLRSVYHPDATDDHGEFVGSPEEFIQWVVPLHNAGQISTQHHLTNHSCELDGDTAHTETYYIFTARNRDETVWVAGGRYIDRFEKRSGEWKIATRYCTVEWSGTVNEGPIPFADIPDVHTNGVPSRDRSDPSYRRPLTNSRAKRFPQTLMSVEARETIAAAELREAIEGIYTMAAWYNSTGVAYAPAADGRWVLVDGVFISLLLKREADGSKQTIAMMGTFDIEDGAFTYGYDDGSYLIQRPDGAVDAPKVPYGERRRFDAIRDGSIIRLVWNDGAAEFRLGGLMIDYLEHGVVQRRWARVEPAC